MGLNHAALFDVILYGSLCMFLGLLFGGGSLFRMSHILENQFHIDLSITMLAGAVTSLAVFLSVLLMPNLGKNRSVLESPI